MALTRTDIDAILSLVETTSLSEILLEQGETRLHLRRRQAAPAPAPAAPPPLATEIRASLLGMFQPIVRDGDSVEAGATIGAIDVLGASTPVTSPAAGRITALAGAGALAEYGQLLATVTAD